MKQYKTLDMNDGRGGEHIQTHARPLWIISTFLISYLLNLASSTANVLWLPDPLALTLIYWTIHHPRHVGMTIAFICGLLMDVQNGSVLGQQALAYVILSYSAYSLHRRLPWFGHPAAAARVPARRPDDPPVVRRPLARLPVVPPELHGRPSVAGRLPHPLPSGEALARSRVRLRGSRQGGA